jgi:hypothetical protein
MAADTGRMTGWFFACRREPANQLLSSGAAPDVARAAARVWQYPPVGVRTLLGADGRWNLAAEPTIAVRRRPERALHDATPWAFVISGQINTGVAQPRRRPDDPHRLASKCCTLRQLQRRTRQDLIGVRIPHPAVWTQGICRCAVRFSISPASGDREICDPGTR